MYVIYLKKINNRNNKGNNKGVCMGSNSAFITSYVKKNILKICYGIKLKLFKC